ncbi:MULTISPECIES: S41 family peptidase [Bacillus]|uniref:C-terminal processing peptidase n=2 Tax=Bacillus TaxID=1386 RepID=A0A0M5JIL5_9BACI|nr:MULTISPECIES: S41 family peptidase [Bacillus]ALC81319.1 peptidase S41 [Bacillus gobiensis]MBP1080330.1 carboxyl-terminal processing protease [Bacillus capparidis]MED1094192.1 S41 family peptidase [Bacillus capparidis]
MKQIVKLFLVVIITAAAASSITWLVANQQNSPAVSASDDQKFNKLMSTYEKISKQYYEKVDDQKLVDGAIKGMVEALGDPYSTYMDQEEASGFQQNISSSFEGIGAQVEEKNGQILIVAPLKGSPAEEAGLKPHDQILKVDDKSVEGMNVNEAVTHIRGEKGTNVKLVLNRAGVGQVEVTIKRDTIPIETVYSKLTDNKIGEIQITSFSESTSSELTKAIDELKQKGAKGFVLDLRNNPGGLMDQAISMSNIFVDKGKTIMQVESKDGQKEVIKAEEDKSVSEPVVVLVNEGTASAAEIMAAALHQSSDIPIVGQKTFGKGTIQQPEQYSDGSSVKITIAKWLTPDGSWIHEKGIQPDVKSELPDYASLPYLDPEKEYKQGDSGNDIKVVQQMLNALGYKVTANSLFDEKTEEAVKAFQSDNGLTEDGVIKSDTTSGIMAKLQEKLAKNDSQMKEALDVLKKEM